MSPLNLAMLLDIYCSRTPDVNFGGWWSKAAMEGREALLGLGLIRVVGYEWHLTERGSAFVNKVLSTPLPEKRITWYFPDEDQQQ